jgi:hypothetical protein
MAVTVQTGGAFQHADGDRPGLYVRFIKAAIAAIGIGARSKVAIVKKNFSGGTASAGQVYNVEDQATAEALFGVDNVEDIKYILSGGASEVVVATTSATDAAGYTATLQQLETHEFHIFVAEPGDADTHAATIDTWLKANKTDGNLFVVVYGNDSVEGTADAVVTAAAALQDEFAVFVANGVKDGEGNNVSAETYACYVAGLIAGQSIDQSITFTDVPFSDVITRYRKADLRKLLAANVVVTVMDGTQPKIEQGLTLGDTANQEFNKIRTVRAKQAMIDDIDASVNDNYIGQITNDADGQVAVVSAIKAYLTTLADANVIDPKFTVAIDKTQASLGSEVYINVAVKFLDAIEYVYLTVNV